MAKCKYYAKQPKIEQWSVGCTDEYVHPEDIQGDYCQFCGNNIKFKHGEDKPAADWYVS